MTIKTAARGQVPPFLVMDVLRTANAMEAEGVKIAHMELGQPGTAAPQAVRDAVKEALDRDPVGYTNALGLPALREAIAKHYKEAYAYDLDPARVVVTTGSSSGFILSFLSAFDAGDRVALAAPGYPAYRNILEALGVEAVLLPVGAKERFQPTVKSLQKAVAEGGKLDGLILASPSNPAGTMVSADELKTLSNYCAEQGIRLISDEIYHGITFGVEAATALSFNADAIVINSFSKYFSMTGWRLGWMVVPEKMIRPVECLAQNLFISAPTLSQLAGVAVFDCKEELDGYVEVYAENRKLLLERLPEIGFDRLAPADGGFYIYADISAFSNDSQVFCKRLLGETGIAATPGVDFDPLNGHRFMRFSFAGSPQTVRDALDRLTVWMQENFL